MYTQDELKITAHALKHLLASTDLTAEQSLNAEAAIGYIDDLINGNMIASYWTVDDVKSLGEDNDGIAPVTDEDAREVLANAKKYHDASIGINWDVLKTRLDMVREDKEKRAT